MTQTAVVAVIQRAFGDDRDENREARWPPSPRPSPPGPTSSCLPSCSRAATSASTSDQEYFSWATTAEDNPAIAAVQRVTAGTGAVVPVSFFEAAPPAYFNSVAIVEDGAVLGVYRKAHIPDGPGYEEKFYFNPGDTGFRTWSTRHGRIGVGICWDQWFPEAARAMALQGADLLLYPTAIGSEIGSQAGNDTSDMWRRAMDGPRRVQPRARGGGQPDRHRGRPDLLRLVLHRRPPGPSAGRGRPGHHRDRLRRGRPGPGGCRPGRLGLFRDRRPDLYGDLTRLHAEGPPTAADEPARWEAGSDSFGLRRPRCDPRRRRPLLGRGHERVGRGPVDGLTDDVGMAGVPGRLGDEVEQDPPHRPCLHVGGEPRGVPGHRDRLAEIGDRGHGRLGVVGRLPVTGDDAVEGLVRAEAEPLAPIGAGIERRLTVQDGVDPVPLHLFDVLDEPAHAELAGRRHGTGLVVGEPIGGEDEHLALLGQVGEERIALVGHRSYGSGHGGHLSRAGVADPGSIGQERFLSRPSCSPKPVILWPVQGRQWEDASRPVGSHPAHAPAEGQVTAAEVAEELEVSERTARRDLEALGMAGLPVFSLQGRNGGWRLAGGGRTDLSGLSAAEVRALFLVVGPSASATPEVRAALRKLVRALPESFRTQAAAALTTVVVDARGWHDSPAGRPVPPFLDAVQRAVIDGDQVSLGYVDRDGAATERQVDPLGLAAKGSSWYLVADTEAGQRTFRVDRITVVDPTGRPARPPMTSILAATWEAITSEVDRLRYPVAVAATLSRDRSTCVVGCSGRACASARPDPRATWPSRSGDGPSAASSGSWPASGPASR